MRDALFTEDIDLNVHYNVTFSVDNEMCKISSDVWESQQYY